MPKLNSLTNEIASRRIDLLTLGAFGILPNPDPILRRLGRGQEVYEAIGYDAHVISEIRPMRAALLKYEHRINPASDRSPDMQAQALCDEVMRRPPAPGMSWGDALWQMQKAALMGFSVHEMIWARDGSYLLPDRILDREQRRFEFNPDNELMLRTAGHRPVLLDQPHKWLLSRHMPSAANPYGVALFSAIFWPWTFKHQGFRYFVKFAERFGIPWTIGRYPSGTGKEQQDELADALAELVENAVAAVPDSGAVELIGANAKGEGPQERLIDLCNSEISKALSSQTLATEIQGEGSRAASETHAARGEGVAECDRRIPVDTMNALFRSITELNVPGANPPTFEFYEEAKARQEWVDVLDVARKFIQVPASFAHARLQIPMPKDGEDLLPGDNVSPSRQPVEFARRQPLPEEDALEDLLDAVTNEQLQAIGDDVVNPLLDVIRRDGPELALESLGQAYPQMSVVRLQRLLAQVMFVADTWGRLVEQQRDQAD
ncbi:MAG: DUF935 domain-containing protein [Gammaproteobacteria bacterium]|nr:DUF935 domain-containing protein [Gammaproteobacteria bacterium]